MRALTDTDWSARAAAGNFTVENIIEGQRIAISGTTMLQKHAPYDGHLLYELGEGSAADVDAAVASAKAAYDDCRWSGLSLSARQQALLKLADLIEDNREEFALNECLDVGKPIANAFYGDVLIAANTIRKSVHNAERLLHPSGSDGPYFSYHQRGPIGVVAGIAGWNFPLVLACQKLAPALVMGNTFVLKPSEFTSLSAQRVAELALEAGIPEGVFNVVHGAGAIVGDRLARHMDVSLLAFVGSSATGKRLMVASAESNMKRLILECGGKSPYLVFDDCPQDLDFIAADIVEAAFPNQGALCVAGTRLLLQDNMREKLLPKIIEHTQKLMPSNPLDPNTTFGALINQGHLEKCEGYIQSGVEQGAQLLCGGERVNKASKGYYLTPALLDNVQADFKVAQEEVFGPVLSILTFKDEAEAVKLANDSAFGLSSYLATTDVGRIHRLGKQIQAGSMNVFSTSNLVGGNVPIYMEAQKESGLNFFGGVEGLKAYSAGTTVHLYHD